MRAVLYSAVLPGLGQIYNSPRKNALWKVPLLYGSGAVLGYFIAFNNQVHLDFKDSYIVKTYNLPKNQDPYPTLSRELVERQKNYFRRNRDFLIIISIGVYGLNLLDAFVEAHLKTFDVSDKLTLKFEPYTEAIAGNAISGFSIKLKPRKAYKPTFIKL